MEDQIRQKVIEDIENRGFNVINLGNGTFDLIIEGKRPYLVELKIMKDSPRGFIEPDNFGFTFSNQQTMEISKTKYPPIVLAFDMDSKRDKNHLLMPEWVKEETEGRLGFDTAILSTKFCDFPKPIKYSELINKLLVCV